MHAILITAYKDYPALRRLVRRFDPSFFNIYIHIDKRSPIGRPQTDELRSLGAEVSKTFSVRWGSYTHLLAILHLLGEAVKQEQSNYIHIISGQDYPLWDSEEFSRRCDGRIFLDYGPLQEQPLFVRDRYELSDPFQFLLTHRVGSRLIHKFLTRRTHRVRNRLSKRRICFGPYHRLYKALAWSSFPAWAGRSVLRDARAGLFLDAIRNTRVAEEIFFATYFLNSDARSFVVQDDLRYVDWRERNGTRPAYLDETDVGPVLQSNALFARKVNSQCSSKLLDAIDAVRFTKMRPFTVES